MKWEFKDPFERRRWFAWYPVVVDGRWVWLEIVNRKLIRNWAGRQAIYRPLQTP